MLRLAVVFKSKLFDSVSSNTFLGTIPTNKSTSFTLLYINALKFIIATPWLLRLYYFFGISSNIGSPNLISFFLVSFLASFFTSFFTSFLSSFFVSFFGIFFPVLGSTVKSGSGGLFFSSSIYNHYSISNNYLSSFKSFLTISSLSCNSNLNGLFWNDYATSVIPNKNICLELKYIFCIYTYGSVLMIVPS